MTELDLTQSIAHNFLRVADAQPDAPAVCTPQGRWTYAQLLDHARRVALALRTREPDADGHVALLFEHGLHAVASILGVILAGRSYLPIDAAYPVERITYMLQDSGARALLHDAEHAALAAQLASRVDVTIDVQGLRDPAPAAALPARPGDFAYILYTSGSTGAPKGVAQRPSNLLHHIDVWIRATQMGPGDRVSLQSAYGWDSAMQDTFAALLSGAALYPVRFKQLGIAPLLDWFRAEAITVYHSTVPIFRAVSGLLRRQGERWPSLRVLALGGDVIHAQDVEAFEACFAPGSFVLNSYGSTESSSVLMNRHDHGAPIEWDVFSVGSPVLRTRVELAGSDAPGAEGEIVVHSDHIAPGYWGQDPRRDPRYIVDASGRVCGYRSGDLAVLGSDGKIRVRGRTDRQVKIDGMRVDPGEVEAALRTLPAVSDAIVAATGDAGDRVLVAYVVPSGGAWDAAEIARALRRHLPAHCIPARWIPLQAFPLNAHGKLDHAALASLTGAPSTSTSPAPARGTLERDIADVWATVLSLPRVGVEQNFFDLGGTSLKLAMVAGELKLAKGIDVAMVTLYRYPTVRALAEVLGQGDRANQTKARAAERGARRRQSRGQ
jgi:amino acid adenylation domain-containing protein